MSALWAQVERRMREAAYDQLDDDPQILLETDASFTLPEADLLYARLIGLEDEIVKDGLRLPRVEPVILTPIVTYPTSRALMAVDESTVIDIEPVREARYHLQSGYALMEVAEQFEPPVPVNPHTFTATVAYLRYRRRL